MASRYNVTISDALEARLDNIAAESEITKSEVLRKALALFLAAHEGMKEGYKVGLAKPGEPLKTEFVNL